MNGQKNSTAENKVHFYDDCRLEVPQTLADLVSSDHQ